MAKNSQTTIRPLPLLAAALFCDNILEEKESLWTLVRVLDVLTVPRPPEELRSIGKRDKTKIVLPVLAFLSFKSGEAKGEYHLQIDLVLPDGKREKVVETPLHFLGGATGINVKAQFIAPIEEEAVNWYEVRVEGVMLTRMPLEIRHARTEQPTTIGVSSKRKKKT